MAPTPAVAVVGLRPDGRTRGRGQPRWWPVPRWSSDGKPGPVNARSETADRLPTFRERLRDWRCPVPAGGFCEWRAVGKTKVPWRFTRADGGPTARAGIRDVWAGDGGPRRVTCGPLTAAANDTVRPRHGRMPVVLPAAAWDAWLAPDTPVAPARGHVTPPDGPQPDGRRSGATGLP